MSFNYLYIYFKNFFKKKNDTLLAKQQRPSLSCAWSTEGLSLLYPLHPVSRLARNSIRTILVLWNCTGQETEDRNKNWIWLSKDSKICGALLLYLPKLEMSVKRKAQSWLRYRFWAVLEVKWVTQPCPTLCDPVDFTVHGILQARILEWVAFPFSRGSSQPRDWIQVSCIAGRFLTSWATREAQEYWSE